LCPLWKSLPLAFHCFDSLITWKISYRYHLKLNLSCTLLNKLLTNLPNVSMTFKTTIYLRKEKMLQMEILQMGDNPNAFIWRLSISTGWQFHSALMAMWGTLVVWVWIYLWHSRWHVRQNCLLILCSPWCWISGVVDGWPVGPWWWVEFSVCWRQLFQRVSIHKLMTSLEILSYSRKLYLLSSSFQFLC